MEKYFLVTDIHGMFQELVTVLKHWDKEKETLVVMGDMIDRGSQSKEVLLYLYELSHHYPVQIIQGNHEELFLGFLAEPDDIAPLYYGAGGRNTLYSFFGKEADKKTPKHLAQRFHKEYPHLVKWLASAVNYIEDSSEAWTNVFVHAGVELGFDDWRETKPSDFAWIRREFVYGENTHARTRFFFGHTPTHLLHKDGSHAPYISQDNKVGIDAGAWVTQCLYGVKVNGEQYTIYSSEEGE